MTVSLRVLETSDYRELARFLSEQTRGELSESLWLDRFDLFWEINPTRKETEPRGWILTEGENIFGFFGSIPMRYCIDSADTTVYAATSWYVSENLRRRSLELLLPFFKQANGLHTTPTVAVSRILTEFECTRLDHPWTHEELLLPVDARSFAELVASALEGRIPRWAIQPAVNAGIRARSILYGGWRQLSQRLLGNYTYREISEFGPDYDDLWLRFKRRHRVLAVRDAEQLNWLLFGTTQLQRTRRVIEVRRGETLAGYAAMKRIPVKIRNSDRHALELVDLVIDDESPQAPQAFVSGLLSLIETESLPPVYLRTYPLHPGVETLCKRAGFLSRPQEVRYFVKGYSTDGLFSSPLDGDRCFFP